MKTKTILILMAAFVLAVSCKKEITENAPVVLAEKFPTLKAGNRWVYNFLYNGTVYDSLVISISEAAGNEFKVVSRDSEKTLAEYCYAEGDYLKSYTEGESPANAVRIMKYNPALGDTWTDFDGKDSIVRMVKQTDTLINTPAGSYKCVGLEVKYKKSNAVLHYYISHPAGVVKIQIPMQQGSAAYELKGKNF